MRDADHRSNARGIDPPIGAQALVDRLERDVRGEHEDIFTSPSGSRPRLAALSSAMLEKLVDLAVRRRTATLVAAAVFVVFAIFTFKKLKIEAFPDVTNVQVMVITLYPGQAAEEIERQVTIPVERALVGVPDALVQRSITSFGLSQVIVTFKDEVDIYFARQQVTERLRDADVPDGVTPTLGPNDTPVGQVFQYTLESDSHSPSELRSWQDWVVSKRIAAVNGVADVVSFGGFQKEYHVLADPLQLRAQGLTLQNLIDAVASSNAATSGGYVRYGESEFVVRARGYLRSPADIEKTVVSVASGTPVLVRNVARVVEGFTPRRGAVARGDAADSVEGTVLLRRGENPKDVLTAVHDEVDRINRDVLPKGMRIAPFYDRTRLVDTTLTTVSHNMLEGAALVAMVLWLFLRTMRGSLIVAVTMPLALLTAFVGLYYAGVPANLLSMGTIDFGILLDGAVVLVENSYRHLAETKPAPEDVPGVVAHAAKEVLRPILFSMSIIVAAMLPIFTLERVEGRIFRPVALTYAFALGGALFFTLTVIPALTAVLLRNEKPSEVEPDFLVFLKAHYLAALRLALRFPIAPPLVGLVFLVAAGALIGRLGSEFLPEMNEGDIHVTVTMPSAISLERGAEMLRETRLTLLGFPEVKDVLTEQGHPEDGTDDEAPNQAETFVIMRPESEWKTGRTKEQVVDAMREELGKRPGVAFSFSQPIKDRVEESISGIRGQVVVKLYGEDLTLMQSKLEDVRRIVAGTTGARDVEVYRAGRAQHIVSEIDRDATARYGVTVRAVEDVLESAYGGKLATALWEAERRVGVRVKLPSPAEGDAFSLGDLSVPAATQRVPLSSLAKIAVDTGRTQINREKGQRFLALKTNIEGRDMGSFVEEAKQRVKAEVPLPEGYVMTWGGEFENQKRAMGRLLVIAPISVLVIFALLYLTFRSFLPALVVLLDVPFAMVGGVFALYFTHTVLSVSAAVGFITLFGVAVMDGVLLITYVLQAREKYGDAQQAIVDAVSQRLRPVLMTAMLASLGLLPAALSHAIGSDTQRPFAIVIIGGLVSSTILTLLLLPTLYELVDGWLGTGLQRRRAARRDAKRAKAATVATLLLALMAVPRSANAADLTIEDAVRAAFARNRDVIAAKMDIELAEIEKVAASIYPNPVASYTAGNVVLGRANDQQQNVRSTPFGQLVQTVGISEVIDVWAKRSARMRAAERGVAYRRLVVEDALREIAFAVRTSFADLQREQLELDLARTMKDRYDGTVVVSSARFRAGEISEAELRKIELEGLKYQNAAIDAELERTVAGERLAQLLGLPASTPIAAATTPASDRGPLSLPALIERAVAERPDLRAARAGIALSSSSLAAAKREALPDIAVGVAYTHSGFEVSGDNPNSLALTMSLPLPLFDRNQANVARAHLEARRFENEVARGELAVQHQVAEAVQRAGRASRLLDVFEGGGMLDRATKALKTAEVSYQAGAVSLVELLEAQRTYIETRGQYLRAEHDYRLAMIEVTHAVGEKAR